MSGPTTEGPTTERAGGGSWLRPLLLLLSTGALLGVSTNLAKLAGQAGLSPLAYLAWSVAGAAVVLLVVQRARGRLPGLNRRTAEYFVVAGLASVVVTNLTFFAAVPRIGAGFVSLVIALPPLFTYLGALALGMERIEARRAGGVALALAGAALLASYKLSAPDGEALWIWATLGATVVLAFGNLYRTARWPPGETADALAPGMLAASGAMLLLLGAGAALVPGAPADLSLAVPLASIVPVGLVLAQTAVFAVQNLLFFALQEEGGPVYLSLLGSVGAVVGVPVAVLVLGEAWPEGLVAGGALVALGVALLTLGGAKGESPADDDSNGAGT